MPQYTRRIIDLFAHGQYAEATRHDVEKWLADDRHSQEKEQALAALWDETASVPADNGATTEALKRVCALTGQPMPQSRRKATAQLWIWRSAAAVLLLVALTLTAVLLKRGGGEVELGQQYTRTATIGRITLPDGTEVTLNSRSTLIYPRHFNGSTRSVYLSGEACFKVMHDERHPFVVKTADMQVTALGTEFNVSAYPDEHTIESTLVEGKIGVAYDSLRHNAVLTPGQQITFDRDTRRARIARADVAAVTAWQHGEVVIREKTLQQTFAMLERRYPYNFHCSMKVAGHDRYTFHFPENASVSQVMDVIVRVTGKHTYAIEGDECYISRK